MMIIKYLLSLFLLTGFYVSKSKCSSLTASYKKHFDSEDPLSQAVENLMDAHIHIGNFDNTESVLSEAVEASRILTGLSKLSQYNLYVEALYAYIDKLCMATLKKTETTRLSFKKTNEILKRLWFVMNEDYYLTAIGSKYKISDRTIVLIIRTIKRLETNSSVMWPMIRKFGELCLSDECQELVYSAALKFKNIPNNSIPYVRICRLLSNTVKYDAFLIQCREFLNENPHLRNEMVKELAKSIVNGPLSNTARTILLEIVDKIDINEWADNDSLIVRFADFSVRTGIADQIIPLISDKNDKNLVLLKRFMLKLSKSYSIISRVMDFSFKKPENDTEDGHNELMEALEDPDLFRLYVDVDQQAVRGCVIKLVQDIFDLIELIKVATEIPRKIYYLKTIFVILVKIPQLELEDEMILIDFEPLLDILLSPEIVQSNFLALASQMGPIMSLYFTKLSKSHLEKFFAILERMSGADGCFKDFQLQAILFLHIRFIDKNEKFWEALEIIHEFYEERQMDISQLINFLVVFQCQKLDKFTVKKLIDFCEERRIFSKTLRTIAEYFTIQRVDK